jgi:peptide-methionine (S)-S-oxide reductase
MQHPFDILEGIVETNAGYTGGHTVDPAYREVSGGGTGHAESIEITFDPSVISYEDLLDAFWRNIDPTTRGKKIDLIIPANEVKH